MAIILTPGNVADCTAGPECVCLMAGIKKLLGDNFATADGITPEIPGRANRKKRTRHDKEPLRVATSSSAAIAGSRISGGSQLVTTN
jgi:hypothetical protein